MGKKMLIAIFALGLVLLPAGLVKAEDEHSHEHGMGMAGLHGSAESGHAHGEEHTAGTETKHEEAIYTCPMHPEVRENEPGKCPICGMFLERAETSGEAQTHLPDESAEHV